MVATPRSAAAVEPGPAANVESGPSRRRRIARRAARIAGSTVAALLLAGALIVGVMAVGAGNRGCPRPGPAKSVGVQAFQPVNGSSTPAVEAPSSQRRPAGP